jgi:anti-sigma B factor antagonist
METAIGVFSSRERVEEAIQQLLDNKVPREDIVFLTRSEPEAKIIGKKLGAVGGFMGTATGLAAGLIIACIGLVPGVGVVLAMGVGATTFLGLMGAEIASEAAKSASATSTGASPVPSEKLSEDAVFFRDVLKEGRSLIIVRTESQEVMQVACGILDRLGIGITGHSPVKMQTSSRQVEGNTVVDVVGRITMGEGNVMLREVVREMLDNGHKNILLNLQGVGYVDSAGIGELVRTFTTIRNQGGQLKLFSLSKPVHDLLQVTKLHAIFDIQTDEASAIQSLTNRPAASGAGA